MYLHFVCVYVCVSDTFSNSLCVSVQVNSLPADKLQEIQKAIELFSVGAGPAKTMEEATRRSYQFWDTQPVPKLGITQDIQGHVHFFTFSHLADALIQRDSQ